MHTISVCIWAQLYILPHISSFYSVAWLALAISILCSSQESFLQLARDNCRVLVIAWGNKGGCSYAQWAVKGQNPSQANKDCREKSKELNEANSPYWQSDGEMLISLQPH